MSVHRYSMGNRDLVIVCDDDPARCSGMNARYAVRCRRGVAHPTGLCGVHRGQAACCRLCGEDDVCEHHEAGAA